MLDRERKKEKEKREKESKRERERGEYVLYSSVSWSQLSVSH